MNNFRGKKFNFKQTSASKIYGKNRTDEGIKPKVSKFPNVQGKFASNVGQMRPNPYKGRGAFESPSKRMKFSGKIRNEIANDINEFDDDFLLELDNDDFSKDLTVDELNMLEVEASQQVHCKTETTLTANETDQGKTPYSFQRTPQLQEASTYSKNYPEKTLDLYSTVKTMDGTLCNTEKKPGSFDIGKLKQLESDLSEYAIKVQKMEEITFSKDGEIKILRQGLNHTKEERDKLKLELQKYEGNLTEKQKENEKQLQREIERLQTQLQFKDKELIEVRKSRLKQESSKVGEKVVQSRSIKSLENKAVKSSPKPSSSKTQLNENAIFPQNSFASPNMVKQVNLDKKIYDSNSTLDYSQPVSESTYRGLNQGRDEFSLIEKELLELMLAQDDIEIPKYYIATDTKVGNGSESIKKSQFIFQCIQELRECNRQATEFILEMIETHLEKLSKDQNNVSEIQEVDLLCEEPETLLTDHKKNKEELATDKASDTEIAIAGLIVLSVMVKYDVILQEHFLEALNDEDDNKISDTEESSKKHSYEKRYDDFSHIHVAKNASSSSKMTFILCNQSNTKSTPRNNLDQNLLKRMLNKLFHIVTGKKCPQNVKECILGIFISLSSCCGNASKIGLVKKFAKFGILNLFSTITMPGKSSNLLVILKNLCTTPGFESIICSCHKDCPMRTVYAALVKEPADLHDQEWEDLELETIHTLSTVISCCPKALRVMLESECDCSNELIKSLVVALFEEYKKIKEDYLLQIDKNKLTDSRRILLLRQGMSLLSHISFNDKKIMDHRMDVEWQYLDLVYGTIRLYRRIPSISENEVIAVQDLRDIDQYEEFEDSEGQNTDFPMNQD